MSTSHRPPGRPALPRNHRKPSSCVDSGMPCNAIIKPPKDRSAHVPMNTQGYMMADAPNAVQLATELTVAWLSNPNARVKSEEVPAFLRSMHDAIVALTIANEQHRHVKIELKQFVPAVSVRKSLGSQDHIISLIDGKPYRTLRRHLGGHGLTPDEYRRGYGLKADYPMVAPSYRESRRDLAKKNGLGRKPR